MQLVVGHADGAGGARRVGEFLAFQVISGSIPVIWLTVWLALVWQYTEFEAHYGQWWPLHAALLALALGLTWFGFGQPLRAFTRHYRSAKEQIADTWHTKTAGTLAHLQKTYRSAADWKTAEAAINDSAAITDI